MRGQAVQLLPHIGFAREQRGLGSEPVLGQAAVAIEQLRELLEKPRLLCGRLQGGLAARAGAECGDLVEQRAEDGGELRALRRARRLEPRQRLVEGTRDLLRLGGLLRLVDHGLGALEDAGQGQQRLRARWRRTRDPRRDVEREGEELVQHGDIEGEARRPILPLESERGRDIAALEAPLHRVAQRRLQRVEPIGQA